MNAMLILLVCIGFSEVQSYEISCTSIISNKSKPLNCLLVINAHDSLHYVSKFDCNEYSDLARSFLSTGDVSFGYKILTACQDTYESLEHCRNESPQEVEKLEYDPDELHFVCSFYEEAYQLALQQDICFQTAAEIDTLGSSEQSIYTTEFMRGKYITELKNLYTDGLRLKNKIDAHDLSHVLDNSFVSNITGSEMKRVVEEGLEFNKDLDEYRTLLYYVYGPVEFVLFVVGFVGNASLIMLFIRFNEFRTSQNMLLMNLALGDILNLLSNIMSALIVEVILDNNFTHFSSTTCKCIACFQFLSIGLSVYTIMYLSIQRYILIISSNITMCCIVSVRIVVFLDVLAVWAMSIGLCIPVTLLTTSDSYGVCFVPKDFDPTVWNVLFIGVIPAVTITFFYILAACRVAKFTKNMPYEAKGSERASYARNRDGGVLLALSVVFAFSFLPYYVYLFLLHSKYINPLSYWYEYALFKLTFLNPVANPFALYFGSGTFKRHIYVCFSKRSNKSLSQQTKITKCSK